MARTAPTITTYDDLMNTQRGVITKTEAAAVLGVDRRTVDKAIGRGQIPAVELGDSVYIPTEKLRQMIAGEAA